MKRWGGGGQKETKKAFRQQYGPNTTNLVAFISADKVSSNLGKSKVPALCIKAASLLKFFQKQTKVLTELTLLVVISPASLLAISWGSLLAPVVSLWSLCLRANSIMYVFEHPYTQNTILISQLSRWCRVEHMKLHFREHQSAGMES